MKIAVSLMLLCSCAAAAAAQVNFDQGVDVKAAIAAAKSADAAVPAARMPMMVDITRDCRKISFGASDPLTSPVVKLESSEQDQDCQNMGPYVGQICTPSFHDYTADAQIVITAPRELEAGQTETFEVCLWGSFLSMKPVSTIYKYDVTQVLDVFQLTPKGLVQQASRGTAKDFCSIAIDDGHTCIYRCGDGSYVSKPNPFPTIPAANQWVGPISTPCAPTVPFSGSPLITVTR